MKKYELLQNSLKALSENTINLLILKGSAGFSKSYSVKEFLREKKISHKYISTYATPLSFYKILYHNKDKEIIVFDDITTTDKKITSILKSACNNLKEDRMIQWNSTTQTLKDEELPEEFRIKANIILILNEDLPEFKPIINRAITINFKFDFNEKIQILNKFKDDANIEPDIIDYIKTNCNNATKNLSIRTAVILSQLKRANYNWLDFAVEMLNTNDDKLLLTAKLQDCKDIKTACKKWCEQTGMSERTFYNYYKEVKQK